MLTPFKNEPYVDFSQPEPRAPMLAALKEVELQLGRSYPLVINSKGIETAETITSINPARPSQVIGVTARASVEHAEQAVNAAHVAFPSWSRTPPEVRARYVLK